MKFRIATNGLRFRVETAYTRAGSVECWQHAYSPGTWCSGTYKEFRSYKAALCHARRLFGRTADNIETWY